MATLRHRPSFNDGNERLNLATEWPAAPQPNEQPIDDTPPSGAGNTTLPASDWTYAPYSHPSSTTQERAPSFNSSGGAKPSNDSASSTKSSPTILGLPRRAFIALAVILALLLLLITGLGVGLGLSQSNLRKAQSTISSLSSASPGDGSPSPTSPPIPSPTRLPSECPSQNGTIHTTPDGKQFRRACGIDFSGTGAVDLGSERTGNFSACMDACAAAAGCTGCGWGFVPGDEHTDQGGNMCWMKSNLTKSHVATNDWAFAVLVSGGADLKVANFTALFHESKRPAVKGS